MPTDLSPAARIRGHLARVTALRAQALATQVEGQGRLIAEQMERQSRQLAEQLLAAQAEGPT